MSARTATDHLSLSIPDWRTALKKRFKKPPKPASKMFLALAIFSLACIPIDFFIREKPVFAVVDLFYASFYWRWAWLEMDRWKPVDWAGLMLMVAAFFGIICYAIVKTVLAISA
jgi:hypothetical protein